MFAALDISTSALVAQRTRMTAIANNLANMNSTRNEAGELEPYQPRHVIFQTDPAKDGPFGAAGVRVEAVETADVEPSWKFDPTHPDAVQEGDHKGYVAYPNISMMHEFTNAIEATRSYEANVGVIEMSKDLMQQTLRILA